MCELLKYGGSGMVSLLVQLFSVVWHEEAVPRQWRGPYCYPLRRGSRELQRYYITECCRESVL